MPFCKTLAHRLLNMTKILKKNPNSSESSSFSSETKLFRRSLQKRPIFEAAISPEFRSLPIGDKVIGKLRGVNGDGINLDGLVVAPRPPSDSVKIDDVRKLLRHWQLEKLKCSLRRIPRKSVSYTEFVEMCRDGVDCWSGEEALGIVRTLDESGVVLVLGNVVFLRPEQVAKEVEAAILLSMPQPNDARRRELKEMEKEKANIDKKAESLVQRELRFGLCFLMVQTAGFMRLTFWELSWDVMEPICFCVTSVYFMAGYAFFLRTSKDPSFEGFFETRFSMKQKRLMKIKNFNIERFNELRKTCDLSSDCCDPS